MKSRSLSCLVGGLLLALAGFVPVAAEAASDPAGRSGDTQVDRVAAYNDLSRADAASLVRDPYTRVTDRGAVYFVDPAPTVEERRPAASGPRDAAAPTASRLAPDVFALHSDPSAEVTIYLDFDGEHLTRTGWNRSTEVGDPHDAPPWSLDEDVATYNSEERSTIEGAWRAVSEDFAIFRVDVTTEDPGPEALLRTSAEDPNYGSHVVITPDGQLEQAWCPLVGGCGGVAFYGDFDQVREDPDAVPTPALVFSHQVQAAEDIAAATSHEVGHNLSLMHDGLIREDGTRAEYYSGFGDVWAPLMGAGYKPLNQWSNGDYPGATNQEDDLTIIASHGATARVDEAPATLPGTALPNGTAYINKAGDRDVFTLPSCDQRLTVVGEVSSESSNLDLTLEVLDAAGRVIAADDAPVRRLASYGYVFYPGRSGLLTVPDASAARAVRVRGGSDLADPRTGYSAYGSVGGYTLEVDCGPGSAPGVPRDVRVEEHANGGVRLSWQSPTPRAGAPVTAYRMTYDGTTADLPSGQLRAEVPLSPDRAYDISIAAVSPGGVGDAVRRTGRTISRADFDVLETDVDPVAGRLTLRWSDASTDVRTPVTGWRVIIGDGLDVPADARSFTYTGLRPGEEIYAGVCPLSSGQDLGCRGLPVRFGRPASSPRGLRLGAVSRGAAELSWTAPADLGDGALRHYQWSLDGGRWQDVGEARAFLLGLVPGRTYAVAVRAVTEAGFGQRASSRVTAARVPEAPTGVSAVRADRAALVSWTAPNSDVPITSYRITARGGSARELIVPGDRSSAVVDGLSNGTRYDFIVEAISDAGVGARSQRSNRVVPATIPGRVEQVRARVDRRTATITWAEPADNGAPIVGYQVTVGRTSTSVQGRRLVLRNLRPGRYRIQVWAVNDVGPGSRSRATVIRVKPRGGGRR